MSGNSLNDQDSSFGRCARCRPARCRPAAWAQAPAPLVPIALVEDMNSTSADVEFMDYVGTGQVIKLAPHDTLVLSYLKSCEHETITGGTVTIGAEQERRRRAARSRAPRSPATAARCSSPPREANASGASRSACRARRSQPVLYAMAPMIQLPKLQASDARTLVIERVDQPGERVEFAIGDDSTGVLRSRQGQGQAAGPRRRLSRDARQPTR